MMTSLASHNPAPAPAKGPAEPSVADLLKQIADIGKQLDEVRQTNMALMAQPPAYANAMQREEPVSEGPATIPPMPDPVTDPDGYRQWLGSTIATSVGTAINAYAQQQYQAQTAEQQADALWDRFSSQHADVAKHPELVQVAVSQLRSDLVAKGVDVKRYMQVQGDKFLADVAARVKTDYAPMFQGTIEGGPAGSQPVSRTAGVFGGAEGGGGVPAAGGAAAPGSMASELQAMQKKDGYF